MRRYCLFLSLLLTSWAVPSEAALQFLNVTSPVPTRLLGVACDTNATFIAVGTNSTVLKGTFITDHEQWTSNGVPASISLLTATFGNNVFLAGGTGGTVLTSTDGGSTWGSAVNPFPNSAFIEGVGFNPKGSKNFVAAAAAVEIAYSPAKSPTSWSLGTLANSSFVESFRAVTWFGANSFAACGIGGDIRVSSDGGTNWSANRLFNSGQANLLGIASDGNNRLVAAGVSGTTLSSTDGGTTWSTPASQTAQNLNAIAYDPADGLFMSVGDSGTVLTSADGNTWTSVSAGTNLNFHGVAFGRTGNLLGVGLLVGDFGRAYLVGTPPAPPVNPVNQTICALTPSLQQTNPLTVTIVPDGRHPAGTVGVDWYDQPTGGNRVQANSALFAPPNKTAPPNAPTNYTYYAEARDLRTGFISSNRVAAVLTVNPRPTATLTPSTTLTNCNIGTSYTLVNTLTGLGSWTVWWNDGYVQTTNFPAGPVTLSRTITPTNTDLNTPSNNTFYVTIVSNTDFCLGNQPGDILGTNTVWINPRPTAALTSFATTNCNVGTLYTLTNQLTGVGPWTVWWNDGLIQTAAINAGGPVLLTRPIIPTNTDLNIPSNNIFSVMIVSNADGCVSDFARDISGSVSVRINPRPTASLLSFTTTNCNLGTPYTLTNTLTGQGPWTVWWNDGQIQTNLQAGAGPATLTRFVVPTNTSLDVPSNNTFFVTAISNADTCTGNHAGDIKGSDTIWINPRPMAAVSLLTAPTNCAAYMSNTIIRATLHGIAPWIITWSDGTKQTNFTGTSDYPTVTLTNLYADVLTNFTLSVTNLTDANCVALTNDLSGSESVTIFPNPSAIVTGTTNICNGQLTLVQAELHGIGPTWTVTWSDGTVNANVARTSAIYPPQYLTNFYDNAATNYDLRVVSVLDNGFGCQTTSPNYLHGNALVTVNPRPKSVLSSLSPVLTNCNVGTVFTLTNTLSGLGPWTVRWNDGFVQTDATLGPGPAILTRAVTPTNSALDFPSNNTFFVTTVSNADTCLGNQAGDIQGSSTFWINPRPSATVTLLSYPTNCTYNISNTVIQAQLHGIAPWVVTWSDGTQQTNITGAVNYPTFTLTNIYPDALTNYTLSITNLTDAHCVAQPGDLKGSGTITLFPTPSAIVIGSTNICNGQLARVQAQLHGIGPTWSVVWSDGTQNQNVGRNGAIYPPMNLTNIYDNAATNYILWVVSVFDNGFGCQTTSTNYLQGSALVTVNPRPKAILGPLATTVTNCNLGISYTLTNNLTGLGPWTIWWNDGFVQTNLTLGPGPVLIARTIVPTNTSIDFPSNNTFHVTTISNADTCLGNLSGDIQGSATYWIYPRPSASVSLLTSPTNCAGTISSTVMRAALHGTAPWIISWSDGTQQTNVTGSANYPTANLTNVYADVITNFTLSVTNLTDARCTAGASDLSGSGSVTVYPAPSAIVNLVTNVCNGQPVLVQAALRGIGPTWTVTWSDGSQNVNVGPTAVYLGALTNIYPNSPTNYFLSVANLVDNAIGCSTTSTNYLKGTAIVTINPRPAATLAMGTNDFSAKDSNGTNLITSVIAAGTNFFVNARFGYYSNYTHGSQTKSTLITLTNITLFITNHVTFTGTPGWTNTWRQVSADPAGAILSTNDYSTNYSAASDKFVWRLVIANGTPGTNFTYTMASLQDADCVAGPADISSLHVTFNSTLSAFVYVPGPSTLCNSNGSSVQIFADLGGLPPWKMLWNDGVSNYVASVTNLPFTRLVSPTNYLPNVASNFYYYVTNLANNFTNTADTNALTGIATVIVDPVPGSPPISLGNQYTCYGLPGLLVVSVPNGFTADWYSDSNGLNPVAFGTTNLSLMIGNFGGTTNLWAAARFNDPLLTNACRSALLTMVSLTSTNCSPLMTNLYFGSNGVGQLEWSGNWILQTNTTLNPLTWSNAGFPSVFGNNLYYWSNPPPIQFFRLYAPTN